MLTDDDPDNPTMAVTFPPLTSRVAVSIGTHFDGDENSYAVWMHMGSGLQDSTSQPDTSGSAAVFPVR